MSVESPTKSWRHPSFPSLPAVETSRRERWWFSDGAWIDQGQTGSVIGVVLTHWLADRGVEAPGKSFDETYARNLYHASQRQAGRPESDSGGAQLSAGVQVLQSDGLVEACFACRDMASVTGALLERGPVVGGVTWYQSMFEPTRIDGVPVVRVPDEDSGVVGGHALLFDGIALDLQLDGITGFVRFKNSWGRAWGQNGLCLISIADLERLVKSGEFLLLTPPPDLVNAGLPSEDENSKIMQAMADAPPQQPEQSLREITSYEPEAIGRDLWTTDDTVGYAVYANSIARGIQHHDTKPPLTIGIKAPWGAGKTSLMRMVQRRLEWPQTWPDPPHELRPIRLAATSSASDETRVTNGALLKALRAQPAPKITLAKPEPERPYGLEDDPDWRPTVWFNPWMYQTGEQVWAGFAHELVSQITNRMPRGQRERFWMRLNLERVDEQVVRRKIYALLIERVVPWALVAVVVLVGAVALALAGIASKAMAVVAAGTPVLLVLITALKGGDVRQSDVGGSLATLLQPATAARRFADNQLSGMFDELVPAFDYRDRSGFFHFVQTDVQRVLDLVATEGRPLVVFVDDLDRCAPGTVVQVIEAINLFLAGQFQNAVFVIALEPEMVAAHIEAAYADLVERVETSRGPGGRSEILGWRFLEKFIQLPLTLPLMEATNTEYFLAGLFASSEPISTDSASAAPRVRAQDDGSARVDPSSKGEKAAATAAAEQMLAAASLGKAVKLAEVSASGSAFGEALRRVVARKLAREDPEMHQVIDYVAPFLTPNPREIKRFANVFRFYVMIATERRLADLEAPQELSVLAKLAVLSTRWPSIITDLARHSGQDEDRTVFELLEDSPHNDATDEVRTNTAERRQLARALAAYGLSDASTERLLSDDLRKFMLCEPRIGKLARDWL